MKENRLFDEPFIHSAYDFSQIVAIGKIKAPVPGADRVLSAEALHGRFGERSGNTLTEVKSALRITLLHLWSKKVIQLPLTFLTETSLTEESITELLTEVAAFFWFYNANDSMDSEQDAEKRFG